MKLFFYLIIRFFVVLYSEYSGYFISECSSFSELPILLLIVAWLESYDFLFFVVLEVFYSMSISVSPFELEFLVFHLSLFSL